MSGARRVGALVLASCVGTGCGRAASEPRTSPASANPREEEFTTLDDADQTDLLVTTESAKQPLTGSTARDLAERFVRAVRGEPSHDLALGPALTLAVAGKRSRHTSTASLGGALGLDRASLSSLELDPASVWSENTSSGAAVHAELRWSESGRAGHAFLVLGVARSDLDYAIVSATLQEGAPSADPPE